MTVAPAVGTSFRMAFGRLRAERGVTYDEVAVALRSYRDAHTLDPEARGGVDFSGFTAQALKDVLRGRSHFTATHVWAFAHVLAVEFERPDLACEALKPLAPGCALAPAAAFVEAERSLDELLLTIVAELGDVHRAVERATADHRVTPAEDARVRREFAELRRALDAAESAWLALGEGA